MYKQSELWNPGFFFTFDLSYKQFEKKKFKKKCHNVVVKNSVKPNYILLLPVFV